MRFQNGLLRNTQQKLKSPDSLATQDYSKSEISMKQTASHSQTPQFGVNKSATSARLYQHPTLEEQRSKGWKNIVSNISMITVLAFCFGGSTFLLLKGCADEQERQTAVIQAQIVKGGK